MSVSKEQLVNVVSTAIESMRSSIETDLRHFVEDAIEAHRRRMWVREKWCCTGMVKFATHFWAAPNPPKRDTAAFGIELQIRGETLNYCPFCGVGVK